jgi:hypothetical protein
MDEQRAHPVAATPGGMRSRPWLLIRLRRPRCDIPHVVPRTSDKLSESPEMAQSRRELEDQRRHERQRKLGQPLDENVCHDNEDNCGNENMNVAASISTDLRHCLR